jgi:hypothetical protein
MTVTAELRDRMEFDPVRGVWFHPDLSDGNLKRLLRAGGEWPISGDDITRTKHKIGAMGLLGIVDWASMEDEHDD